MFSRFTVAQAIQNAIKALLNTGTFGLTFDVPSFDPNTLTPTFEEAGFTGYAPVTPYAWNVAFDGVKYTLVGDPVTYEASAPVLPGNCVRGWYAKDTFGNVALVGVFPAPLMVDSIVSAIAVNPKVELPVTLGSFRDVTTFSNL